MKPTKGNLYWQALQTMVWVGVLSHTQTVNWRGEALDPKVYGLLGGGLLLASFAVALLEQRANGGQDWPEIAIHVLCLFMLIYALAAAQASLGDFIGFSSFFLAVYNGFEGVRIVNKL